MALNADEFIKLLIEKFMRYFRKRKRINLELDEIKKERKRSRIEALKLTSLNEKKGSMDDNKNIDLDNPDLESNKDKSKKSEK